MNKSKISDATRRQLTEMFLPELHQAWWAETLAQLRDRKRLATDDESRAAIELLIREHYKLEHDIELTRTRVLASDATKSKQDPEASS